jgi:predicted RNA-binding Zn ribbon-like protein
MDRYAAGPQPAGRPAAPGRLGYVQAFVNSFWDLAVPGGQEMWSSPAEYEAWLHDRGFDAAPGAGDLHLALGLRETLRALFRANHAGEAAGAETLTALDAVARELAPAAGLTPSLVDGALRPTTNDADAACALALAVVFEARGDGSFARMKACPHEHCGWVFYDTSRNRSGQWCSMRICGNRTKGATFRRRRAAGAI